MTWTSDELRQEIERLREQVEALKKPRRGRNRRLGILLAGAMLGLAAGLVVSGSSLAQAQNDDGKILTCRAIKITAPDGKEMAVVGHDADGGFLRISGNDGKVRALLTVASGVGPGQFSLFSPDEKLRVALYTDADGGGVRVFGKDNNPRAFLGVAPNVGGGLLNLWDTNRKVRLILEGADRGGQLDKR
jgi:hypothetical protein